MGGRDEDERENWSVRMQRRRAVIVLKVLPAGGVGTWKRMNDETECRTRLVHVNRLDRLRKSIDF